MNYKETYPLNVTQQGDTIRQAVEKNRSELMNLVSTLNAQPSGAVGDSRQRVLSALTVSGAWNYLSSDGLTVVINGNMKPVVAAFADGADENGNIDYVGTISSKVSAWSLPINNTSYIYLERGSAGTITYGFTTVKPVSQALAPTVSSSDTDVHWFSTNEFKMYVWNGTAWQHKVRLFLAKVTTDGSSVISIDYLESPQQLAPSLIHKLEAMDAGATNNGDAYSIIKIGSTNVEASGRQSDLTIAVSGLLSISADAANRKITISAPTADAIYAQAKLDAHPVGSIYESTVSTSPAELFGGTWEKMEAGRALVSQGTAKTGTVYTAGSTAGTESETLTTNQIPPHAHYFSATTSSNGNHNHAIISPAYKADDGNGIGRGYNWDKKQTYYTEYAGNHTHTVSGNTNNTGGGWAHNNMMPYEVVYRWRRTA